MRAQEFVAKKHLVEAKLVAMEQVARSWFSSAELLTTPELEIAVAKTMDKAAEKPKDRAAAIRARIMIASLKYRDKTFQPSGWNRFWNLTSADQVTSRLLATPLDIPEEISDQYLDDLFASLLAPPK